MDRTKPYYFQRAFAGLFAAFVLLLTSLVFRVALGVGTIAELASDRLAPLLPIPIFFRMLGAFGGYSHLKQLGVVSVFLAELFGGLVAGIVYARLAARRDRPRSRKILSALIAAAFLLTIVLLWPNLQTNYKGLPPGSALVLSVFALALQTALFLAAFFWAEGELYKRVSAGSPLSAGKQADPAGRRHMLVVGGAAAAVVAVSGGLLAYFYRISAYGYDGTENAGDDLSPITSNEKFYQVTKNNVDPSPTLGFWALEIGGDVAHPATLHLSDLQALPPVVQEVTLQCISNQVGGGLNSNADWKGVRLREVIERCGPAAAAKQVRFHGADGFIDELPVDKAMDPQTLLVFEMNGQSLPLRHGYPLRLIVPGYVGEKSVKWLTKVEVRVTPEKGFYEQQGWGPKFTINTSSRFDSDLDDDDHPVRVGQRTVIKGTAFAGDRGVKTVEVSTDDEKSWQPAEITYHGSNAAWVQWRFPWQPAQAGTAMLAVRCIDGQGNMQSSEVRGPGPNPATGLHKLSVDVKA